MIAFNFLVRELVVIFFNQKIQAWTRYCTWVSSIVTFTSARTESCFSITWWLMPIFKDFLIYFLQVHCHVRIHMKSTRRNFWNVLLTSVTPWLQDTSVMGIRRRSQHVPASLVIWGWTKHHPVFRFANVQKWQIRPIVHKFPFFLLNQSYYHSEFTSFYFICFLI